MRTDFSRRDIVAGGTSGLLLSLLALAGCRNQAPYAANSLPGPVDQLPPPPPGSRQQIPAGPRVARGPGASSPIYGEPGVIARQGWTRTGVARPGDINPLGQINRITIHHDGIDAFTSTSQADAINRIEMIRTAHVNQRKFADIGYHYIVDPGGRVWEGRSIKFQGAHVRDQNENNLGIMCLGNFDLHTPSGPQTQSLDRFVAAQMRRYSVPISRVYTHQEINPTACPGRNLQRYMLATRGGGGQLRLALTDVAPELVVV